jgi:DNA-binding SARP family transcriptional activator
MGNDNHITHDREFFERATKRAVRYGANTTYDAVVFLEKEIEGYRERIDELKAEAKRTAQLEAVQESTVNEIIKALANNGYNTITINCYRDTESEE